MAVSSANLTRFEVDSVTGSLGRAFDSGSAIARD